MYCILYFKSLYFVWASNIPNVGVPQYKNVQIYSNVRKTALKSNIFSYFQPITVIIIHLLIHIASKLVERSNSCSPPVDM